MPSYNTKSGIIRGNNEGMASTTIPILDFHAPVLEAQSSEAAKQYIKSREEDKTRFRMNDIMKQQTGVDVHEANVNEKEVEKRVVERLKEVQEKAYEEAYQLGLAEGIQKSWTEKMQELSERIGHFDELMNSLEKMKLEVLKQNEAHMIELIFSLVKRLTYYQVEIQPEVVGQALREALELAQVEEHILVQVAPDQFEFLESLRKNADKKFMELTKNIKLEAQNSISIGGCRVTTNFGEVDATIETRVEKLWLALQENLPRRKNIMSVA